MPRQIGTRNETSLHRELKYLYVGEGQVEAEIAGFVVDGINPVGEYIEVQTGSFGPLRQKAAELASRGRLKIVHPIIIIKYLEVYDAGGVFLYRRKSTRRGTPWDLFDALIHAPCLPLVSGLSIILAPVDVAERRVQDGKGSWRRRGLSIHDRAIIAKHEHIELKKPVDYLRFVPFKKDEEFTSATLGEKARIKTALARKTLYVLNRLGLIEKIGKRCNSYLYQFTAKSLRRKW